MELDYRKQQLSAKVDELLAQKTEQFDALVREQESRLAEQLNLHDREIESLKSELLAKLRIGNLPVQPQQLLRGMLNR
ncbi:MAG: hypothetical protein QF805_24850 [Pirellulaceae bacterium]|nr:hypothetical protein [Pirellulaceae bacterium]